ncbi:MAG: hypothetical protein HY013_03845 [Candidatus Solibacter usitatus]|nr:hypothetical protein [Candidatus Solibacter usitatus]
MRGSPLTWVLLVALSLPAQTRLSVEQLVSFVESSIKLKHPDRQVAVYLQKLKLSERLDDRQIEELQGNGAGPKTLEALRALRDASRELPKPPPKVVQAPPPPIPPPSVEEQRRVIEETREYALNYSKSLPDFICTQVTRRYYDPSGLEFWQRGDTLTTRLSYFERKENYKLVLVNNQYTDLPYESLGGVISAGEFGSMMREIFEPTSHGSFRWERWATLGGRRAHVLAYRIQQVYSKYRLNYERRMEVVVGYSGSIFVDQENGGVLRVTLEAQDIPPTFPVHQVTTVLDYRPTLIGEREYLLPLKAAVRSRMDKFLSKNEVEFRLYRKFAADATITFTPDALPEEQTKEQPVTPPPAPPPSPPR